MVDRAAFDRYLELSELLGDFEPPPMGPYDDERVETATQTCWGCPDAYEGRLVDGREFYFRYRYGHVTLRVSHGEDDERVASRSLGDSLQGVFESSEQRDRVFSQLLNEIDRSV